MGVGMGFCLNDLERLEAIRIDEPRPVSYVNKVTWEMQLHKALE
jgi:hypothetical protein